MSSQDKTLISDLMESFVSEVPAYPFVSFCVFCNKGVIKEDMTYQKGLVFHKDCYNSHGNDYPPVNQALLNESINAKVQLIQLKNLKVRLMNGTNNKNINQKTKKKSKQKAKRKISKRRVSRKRTSGRRKKAKKIISRKKNSKRRQITRRRIARRKKTTRKTKRRSSKRTKRRSRRR